MTSTYAPRRIASGLMAVTLALLVAGVASSPAHAADKRKAQVAQTNQYIADCFSSGGDPDVYINEKTGSMTATCGYDEGMTYCIFKPDGTKDCGHSDDAESSHPLPGGHPLLVDGPLLVAEPVITDGGTRPTALGTAATLLTASQKGRVASATTNQEQDQDHDTRHAKQGKNGQKGGKGRRK